MGKGMTLMLSALIILAMLSEIQGWNAPNFCHRYNCPEFTVVDKNAGFEERMYVESTWMTVHVKNTRIPEISDAFKKLDVYCKGKNIEGRKINAKTWPVLIRRGVTDDSVSISWYFTPDTQLPESLHPAVVKEVRPAGLVYVRNFNGIASLRKAVAAWDKLKQELTRAGKDFDDHLQTGVIYNYPWDIVYPHYSEIWLEPPPQEKQ